MAPGGPGRLERRIIAVLPTAGGLCTRLRIAPAGAIFGLLATLTWNADGLLSIHVVPDGS